MPDNRVIAQGGVPGGSINALAGAQAGQGLGQGLGARIGQNMALRRQARQLNPLREFLLEQLQQNPVQSPSLQQQVLQQALQDPRQFAQVTGGNIQGVAQLAGQFQPKPFSQRIVISGDSEINQSLGLGIPEGSTAITELMFDQQGGNLIGANVITEPDAPGSDAEGSFKDRQFNAFNTIAPLFAEGRSTPGQDMEFTSFVTDYIQPSQFQDPDTGLLITKRRELPPHVRSALRARGFQIDESRGLIQAPQGFTAQPQQSPQDMALEQAAPPGGLPPQDPETPTLFELFAGGSATGPVPTIRRGLFRVTGDAFVNAAEETEAFTFITALKERAIDGLRRNPRFAEGEAERLLNAVDLQPSLFRQKESAMSTAIGFDDVLATVEREMEEVVTGRRQMVSGETRRQAMDTLQTIRSFRQVLAPERVKPEQLEQFAQTAPPGKRILVDFAPGDRVPVRVFQRIEDAQQAVQNAQPGEWFFVNGQWFQAEAQ